MRYQYPAILIPAEEGGYTVLVPDLPGCVTQGETVEEAFEMAKDAIAGWIEVALEYNEEVPGSSTLEQIAGHLDEFLEGVVETKEERDRVILANVQLDLPEVAA
ncbi:MAG: pilus assembly protein HicB [Candidatus Aquicultor secundus]|uniref:Pilus assembly protein HicB n=1 Tax=Candidatus Aquicultor secundus TaxID=1973895 RepID=A0A2M7T8P1_9ACTN|nr:type II toxin-antitoxin system HicB family antitoxin [Candidatus Aquicultor secundus]NCO66457.1 type II toxin-antitoxin system HicB family antitoxin [Solirubrobacter sp.]OIO83144.1 MAG: hypothetical protein AUK32_10470 [Candidatus Aquicultor secundus]PIU27621.1 MAG: pilus assembly protein HicB [Candidatus Aquicultor secundus]PIW22818.1 MAG: pilus assembly protein HicB [Candidatus Aquicultor secundus]PIX52359.1 MAG: pilus assembly protein HicB [Candidatus Aquicultor secundus]